MNKWNCALLRPIFDDLLAKELYEDKGRASLMKD
jgi:hypothetical protein